MTQHTKAPWKATKSIHGLYHIHHGLRKVASIALLPSDQEREMEANARLIADAPNMREWLRQIVLTNCTCDSWENAAEINPAKHDEWCMYRVMTGYQDTAEKESK